VGGGADDGLGLRIDLWGRLWSKADEDGSWDTPCLAAPDLRINLGQAMTGASRRMVDQTGEWAGGAGPWRE
jgi:hypothetical protein